MKTRSLTAVANIGFLFLLLIGGDAGAAELKVLSALATRTMMEELGPTFKRTAGYRLAITFATAGEAVKRVQGGEVFDVVILPRPAFASLLKGGKTAAEDVTDIARSGIGIAIRKGASRPDISSPEALRRTLLAATSITYANPAGGGAAGIHFSKVLDRLGIAEQMKSKTTFHPRADETGILVANGEAEIGVNQFQVLMPVAGIDIVGPLPGDLQDTIVFAAAIMAGASNAEGARALVASLRSLQSAAVIRAKGMEPASP